jgi:hypothetical protein
MNELLFKVEIQGITEDVERLGRVKDELSKVKNEISELTKAYNKGAVETKEYHSQLGALEIKSKALSQESTVLKKQVESQAIAFKGAEGSMTRMNLELGNARQRYRDLTQAERDNAAVGGVLLNRIQTQDAEIKRLDASIGNHQRNVGNYTMIVAELNRQLDAERARFAALTAEEQKNAAIGGQVAAGINRLELELKQANSALNQTATSTSGFGASMKSALGQMLFAGGAVGVAVMAFGKLKDLMADGIKDAMAEERGQVLLRFALEGNAQATERMIRLKEQLFQTTLFSKDEIASAINLGLELGRTEIETRKMIEAAMGLSRVTGKDLNSMMLALNGTYEGQVRGLGRLAGEIKDLSKTQLANGDAVDILNKKYGKFASEGMNTMEGKVVQMKKWWKETWESIGFFSMNIIKGVQTGLQAMTLLMSGGANVGQVAERKYNSTMSKLFSDHKIKMDQLNAEIASGMAGPEKQKGSGDDTKQVKSDSDKINTEYQDSLKSRTDLIGEYNEYILKLSRDLIERQIEVMREGKDKEIAIENNTFQNTRNDILNEAAEKEAAIDEEIKGLEKKGRRITTEEKKQLEELKSQKIAIIDGTNKAVEANETAHNAKMLVIDDKYSKTKKDNAAIEDYTKNVESAQSEYDLKLQVVKQFYAAKGTLTDKENKQQTQDELKLSLELANKKYQLLDSELKARMKIGDITREEIDSILSELATIYGQVKTLEGQAGEGQQAESKSGFMTQGIASMFGIQEGEADQIYSQVQNLLGNIQNMWLQAQQQKINLEIKAEQNKLDKMQKTELKELTEKRKKGLITEKQYEEGKEAIDEKYEKAKKQLEKEQFERNKKLSITNAIISGALAVLNALNTQPMMPLGIIMAALAAIAVGIQIATISATKYEGAKGGMLQGRSHADGGIAFRSPDTNIELEGGEAVLNKRSMASNDVVSAEGTPRQIASWLNSMNGYGVPFEFGGVVRGGSRLFQSGGYSPSPIPRSYSTMATGGMVGESITKALSDQRVYVVESDISETQEKVKRVKVEATW